MRDSSGDQRRSVGRLAVAVITVLASWALGACVHSRVAAAPSAAPLVAPGHWVIIGSSSAEGVGASTPSQAWAARLRSDMLVRGVSIANLALGGSTTYAGIPIGSPAVSNRPLPLGGANIEAALASGPKLVIVAYPTNDTEAGFSESETVRNLLAIRAAALARNVAVVIQGTQPRNMNDAKRALLPQIDAQLALAVGSCFVEVRSSLAAADGRIAAAYDSGDGVHVNDAGHALIHSRIMSLLDVGTCVKAQAP